MLRLANKRVAVYKEDYKPVEIYQNNKKIHGFKTFGTTSNEVSFAGTYNYPLTIYGVSGCVKGKNLCPPPQSTSGSYDDAGSIYNWEILTKENGYFDVSGAMITGVQVTKALLAAGTYTASGCEYLNLWWDGCEDFITLPATFTLEEETEVLGVMWYISTESISLKDQYIQIEKSSRATAYSEYVGNSDFPPSINNKMQLEASSATISCMGGVNNKGSYSTEIPELAGFEVPAGHDYVYSVKSGSNNYYYVADVLFGASIRRNIGILKLNGEEEFSQITIQSTTHNCYSCDISHLISKNRIADVCLCNCFEAKTALVLNETGIVLGQNDAKLYFVVEKSDFPTLQSFVQWVVNQHASNPVTVHYILDNELMEDSPYSPAMALPIQTYIKISNKYSYPKLDFRQCLIIQS